ncbi:unnamed protein product [Cylicostephanus goldi]|uniref:Myotubularin phosphatase domain-containing protein n=1 Tax=Cylicostephanus goldi TaxID=71465 RepID=A0A3P7QWX6_CYLGO|nr:unnamed protein product [Cylicostephanus goldi]
MIPLPIIAIISIFLVRVDIPEIINPLSAPDMHRHHLCDYERLRLRGIDSIFRISYANAHYDVVKTYPYAFVVPSSVGDDAFLKIAKGFKHGRFPVITWTSENGALLIRGSGLTQSNEHYLARLAQVSPSGNGDLGGTTGSLASLISIDSLLTADGMSSVATGTPDARRRNQGSDLAKHYATSIRSSGGKPGSRASMINPNAPWTIAYSERQSQKTLQYAIGSLTRKNLYILVEKGHSKVRH